MNSKKKYFILKIFIQRRMCIWQLIETHRFHSSGGKSVLHRSVWIHNHSQFFSQVTNEDIFTLHDIETNFHSLKNKGKKNMQKKKKLLLIFKMFHLIHQTLTFTSRGEYYYYVPWNDSFSKSKR